MECLSTVGSYKIKISYFLFQKGRTGPQPQSDQSKTKLQQCKNSRPNIWDPLRIFWDPPKGLGHFSSSTLSSTHSLTARLRPVPLHPLLLPLVVLPPLVLASPNAGSPAATELHFHQQPLLGSRGAKPQPSPSPLNPGASTATPAAPSPMASPLLVPDLSCSP